MADQASPAARTASAPSVVRVERTIAAEPTSTALLLAGPAAVDLWPGARRAGEFDGQVRVEADLALAPGGGRGGPTRVLVRALPPRRTPISFITRFTWSVSPALPEVSGTLTLLYAGARATRAVLVLRADRDLFAGGVPEMAEVFLANLAAAAEARALAA